MKFKSLLLLPALLVSSLVGLTSCSNGDQETVDSIAASSILLIKGSGDPVYTDKAVNAAYGNFFLGLTRQTVGDREVKITWTSDAVDDKKTVITEMPDNPSDPSTSRCNIKPWYGYYEDDKYSFKLTANLSFGDATATTTYQFNVGCATAVKTTIEDLNTRFLEGSVSKKYREVKGIISGTFGNSKKGIFLSDGANSIALTGTALHDLYDPATMPIGTKVTVIGIPAISDGHFELVPEHITVDATAQVAEPVAVTVTKGDEITNKALEACQSRTIIAKNITFTGVSSESDTLYEFAYGKDSIGIDLYNLNRSDRDAIEAKMESLVVDKKYNVTFILQWSGTNAVGLFGNVIGKTIVQCIEEAVA